jgi:crotonobetainyl-CoA:carnitine CoA-transferase CaiB-like acyl-CoA transferase
LKILDLTAGRAGSFAAHLLSLLGHEVARPFEVGGKSDVLLYHRAKSRVPIDSLNAIATRSDVVIVDEGSSDRFGDVWGSTDVSRLAGTALVMKLVDVDGDSSATGFVLDHALGSSSELPAGDPYREYDGPPVAMPGKVTEHDVGVQVATAALAWAGHHGVLELSSAQATLVTHRYSVDYPEAEPEILATRTLNLVIPFGGVLQCLDGWVEIALLTEPPWVAVAHWLGDPDWSRDPQFPENQFLLDRAEQIQQALRAWVGCQKVAEVVGLGDKTGVPVAEFKRIELAIREAHALEHGYTEAREGFFLPSLPFHPAPRVDSSEGSITTAISPDPAAPLAGIMVVDFTIAQAGAHASWTLAQLGADVIKVENREKLDIARLWSPDRFETSFAFIEPNAGKRGMIVRWDVPEGAAVLDKLIRKADIFISNVRPDSLEKTGFTFERLVELNPRIVYLTISAEGTDAEHRKRPGWAPTFGAASGLGEAASSPGRPPMEMSQWADYAVGNSCALGAVQALRVQRLTGNPVLVDTSAAAVHSLLASDTALARQLGEAETGCRGLMLCYDGLVAFDSGDQRLELPARDLTRLPATDVVASLRARGFSAAVRHTLDEIHFGRNGFGIDPFWRLDPHPLLGRGRRTIRPPWVFDGRQIGQTTDAPWFGQHTSDVATNAIGFCSEETAALLASCVIG